MPLLRTINNKYYWITINSDANLHKVCEILDAVKFPAYSEGPFIGPLPGHITSWCTNVLSILSSIGIHHIDRIEQLTKCKKDSTYDSLLQRVYKDSELKLLDLTISNKECGPPNIIINLNKFNYEHSLGLDQQDLEYIQQLSTKLERPLNEIEIYDLAQSESEHCRHTFFRGKLSGTGIDKLMGDHSSLMSLIKEPWRRNQNNSLVAFSDNSSCIEGTTVNNFVCGKGNKYQLHTEILCPIFTAETHNFPTGICPFPGAATGIGGRIRDIQAFGRFGHYLAGTAGYCVSAFTDVDSNYIVLKLAEKGRNILINASNGASDYGNKFGEPIIQGFCREYTQMTEDDQIISWHKPIMFTGGVGYSRASQLYKDEPCTGDSIVKIGGPAYPLGISGGSASSSGQVQLNEDNSSRLNRAVQRGNPEMLQKMNRVLRSCSDMEKLNDISIIKSIHDQGAGGNANVLREIVGKNGGIVDLSQFTLGDHSMSDLELWIAEYQESNALIIDSKAKKLLIKLAKREKVNVDFVGTIGDNSGKLMAYKTKYDGNIQQIIDLPSTDSPLKSYVIPDSTESVQKSKEPKDLAQLFRLIDIGSKRFLTNKVDRSVSGLVAQQQCIGPLHTPLSNVSIMALDYSKNPAGIAISIGEQPFSKLGCGTGSVLEMLNNMIWAKISSMTDIKCSGNWMWAVKSFGGSELLPESRELVKQARVISDLLCKLNIAIDGGKDSLGMHSLCTDPSTDNLKRIKCPNQVVISGYVLCPDVTQVVTPELKSGNRDIIVYLSVNTENIVDLFNGIQDLWSKYKDNLHKFAGHDVSDGGLITTLSEMCLSSCYGMQVKVDESLLWKETPGLVIVINNEYWDDIHCNLGMCSEFNYIILGHTCNNEWLKVNDKTYLNNQLREWWEYSSCNLEMEQCNPKLAKLEYKYLTTFNKDLVPNYSLPKDFWWNIDLKIPSLAKKVCVLREEGSNGDREMAAAFYAAGNEVYDVTMTDLINKKVYLSDFDVLVLVGGFSYSDVLGAAKGWSMIIKNNDYLQYQFELFRLDKSKLILGVCNGCQLLVKLGWLDIPELEIIKNESNRFESRMCTVKVYSENCKFLQGFDQAILPVWIAHAEGKFRATKIPQNQVVMQYCNNLGDPCSDYPFCPNGSRYGIAGLTDQSGRILALMPHPERCFRKWQFSWLNSECIDTWPKSPWIKLFENVKSFTK